MKNIYPSKNKTDEINQVIVLFGNISALIPDTNIEDNFQNLAKILTYERLSSVCGLPLIKAFSVEDE